MRWLSVDFGIRSIRPAAVKPPLNDLHKIKEIVQVQHGRPHRPGHWTVSCDFRYFLADSPAVTFAVPDPSTRASGLQGGRMERRQFLETMVLGAAATMLGIAPPA